MKGAKVEYTVQPEFAEQNAQNIRRVMEALRANPVEGMRYMAFTKDDGHSFVHINVARDAETLLKVAELQEFKDFQAALKASKPVAPPSPTSLDLVGAGFDLEL